MAGPSLRERLVYRGIEAINEIVEKLEPDEAHEAIGVLRRHLRSRHEQTAPIEQPQERMKRRR